MITIRSIRPDEAGWFASLGDGTVLDPLTGAWNEGRSRPDWTLVAEADGRPLARAALVAGPMGGGIATLEGQVGFLWTDLDSPRHAEAFRVLMDGLAERLAPHGPTTLERRLNPEIHTDIEPTRQLLESSDFELFQEKVGFAWTPEVAPPVAGSGARFGSLAAVGVAAFRRVMAATTEGTLDRNDRYYIDRCGPEPWATEIMSALEEDDESGCLLNYHRAEPVGFVAVGAFDAETWTIVHVGVVPDHRGHGHIAELLAAADRVARQRRFASGLSDVDVLNVPMIAALGRAGHRSDLRPWHVWHYRRNVPRQ